MQRLDAAIPLGRMARPEEIAAAMLFLASEDSSFVAGSEATTSSLEIPAAIASIKTRARRITIRFTSAALKGAKSTPSATSS